jgi:DNA-binding MurR/RpiR family transcriptional regulator
MDSAKMVSGGDGLAAKIAAVLPELSKKHKAIAQFVLDSPEVLVFASAAEVGSRTGTSAATVVRFCQALGYKGFSQLQAEARERAAAQRVAVHRLETRLDGETPEQDLSTRVFATDIHNLERTALLTRGEHLREAASQVRHARQILVVGSGLAAPLADFLTHWLQTLALPARSITGGEEPLALALAFLQSDDAFIGISLQPGPRYMLRALQEARTRNATIIVLADSELSSAGQLADYRFLVATEGAAHGPSLAAAISLLNAFVASLSSDDPDQTARSLRKVSASYRRSGLLDD